jgi:copper homeostasis protein
MRHTLEVIAFNIESCTIIERCGAHRIELCDNPTEGGTTPSYGFIKTARDQVSINLFPIIRPRGGDFLYSEEEYEIMKQDVKTCKQLYCDGIVLGLLNTDGSVDKQRTQKLVELAYPMEVTFHRAFDRVNDAAKALEDVIACGCSRILTSGLRPTASEGKQVLTELIQQADDRIVIMPGSGLRSSNVKEIATATKATEFHTSARRDQLSSMAFAQKTMHETMTHVMADEDEIKKLLNELKALNSL